VLAILTARFYLATMTRTLTVPTQFRLDEVLEAAGMTQTELSRRSGVSLTTINRMANNLTAQVSLATLDRISGVLGVEPGELVERKGKRG
jgi:putative transcriptional regulator